MRKQELEQKFRIRAQAIGALASVNLHLGNSNHTKECAALMTLADRTFYASRNPGSDRLAVMRTKVLDRILFPDGKDNYDISPIQLATIRFLLAQREDSIL